MPFRSLEQGIAAIQQGHTDEGARLLRIALKSEVLQGSLRATAHLWLAETHSDPQEKIRCYNDALVADPDNEHARQRLAQLLAPEASATVSTPAPADQEQDATASQHNPNTPYRTVGIVDGPNGPGTGFFISRDGLVATTRFVVGGAESITIELEPGRRLIGDIVRSYPEIDLALIHTGLMVNRLLTAVNTPHLPEHTALTAIAHNGQAMTGERRATRSIIKPEWFPTTIAQVADAGGSPIFNSGSNLLVGMLTRNTNRTSAYVFGLHITVIYERIEAYLQEINSGEKPAYCPSCGHRTRAGAAGGFYCESCGSVLPGARQSDRFPVPQMVSLYGENTHHPCPKCGSRAGFYNSQCLRCGHMLADSSR
jgi:hypothetical protein